ncbi:MAG: iron-containing alcohol dehydrogenase [Proteobacteria bacterium]|nr:iron-containing alcohol dehydrogenase [Pseudomonadota bacterium]
MNFEFQNPTRLHFGAGVLEKLGKVATAYGKKALIITGGGSVKRNGTFDRAVSSLKASGIAFAECDGVEPNPRITSVRRGSKIARDEGCDVIIALGGGSTMDASKVIAAVALYKGDPWDMIGHGQDNWVIPTQALPIITVPTLAATGSEMNCGAVISNDETKIKSFVQAGTNPGFPVHMIEHALSAHHDITHGAGLAIVNPAWMRFAVKSSPAKFVQFAQRVFGLQAKGPNDFDCALKGISRFEEFLKSLDCPTRLSELGISDELFSHYAKDAVLVARDENGNLPGRPAMTEADIISVLKAAL